MNHKEALQAARINILDSPVYTESVVRAYLTARAEKKAHLSQWPALGCPACNADNLLADFGEEA